MSECVCVQFFVCFFFKQKTAYEMRISDWSSDVCPSDRFIINAHIKVHPMALVHPERTSPEAQRQIRERTRGYAHPTDYFIDVLARGIAKLASPYHPHPAIVRLSDFKTNEYAHLVGGDVFEPEEENPMLGFRGASRYYDDRYREGFALECRALKRVRETMGFRNVIG